MTGDGKSIGWTRRRLSRSGCARCDARFATGASLIGGISRPILWVLILGIGLNPYFRGEVYGEVTFVVPFTYLQFLFPAVVVLNIMYTSVQSAVSVIWDREFGFLREVLVSPLSRGTILLGKVLGGATVAVHGGLVLLLARFADVPLTWTDRSRRWVSWPCWPSR
jgi:ABC-2 type transport system permease protein